MGQPVVHFEVIGQDGGKLRDYYSELFDWKFTEVGGPMDYATTDRESNVAPDGTGIGGGIGGSSESEGQVTFYVAVPDVEAALAKAESLGGTRRYGPDEVPGAGIVIGQFADPEGHVIGVVTPAS